jgi:DNA-binding NtrC family response regulator
VGEAGTGKETLARVSHYRSPARERAFAALDCARLPAAVIARLLFGAPGVGAVYLREPACLPRELQLRLCEWLTLESGAGTGPRIFAGSRTALAEEVRSGRLLEELACALGTLVLEVPPLRQRRDDLPRLVERLLERAGQRDEQPAGAVGLTPAAWEVLRAYSWPGNLRELYAVLGTARARVSGSPPRIDAADLPAALRREQTPGGSPERPLPLLALLEQVERRLIELALRRARGNKTRAAELLSIWRPRLLRRLEALGIAAPEEAKSEE